MVGVLTIGKPASNSLCNGVCGPENAHKVYELNRLITEDNLSKNALSYFVGVYINGDVSLIGSPASTISRHLCSIVLPS